MVNGDGLRGLCDCCQKQPRDVPWFPSPVHSAGVPWLLPQPHREASDQELGGKSATLFWMTRIWRKRSRVCVDAFSTPASRATRPLAFSFRLQDGPGGCGRETGRCGHQVGRPLDGHAHSASAACAVGKTMQRLIQERVPDFGGRSGLFRGRSPWAILGARTRREWARRTTGGVEKASAHPP